MASQIQIKVGKDKNGKFYVSVPKGETVPREIYTFLTKDCKANFAKESNNYFGIDYDPAQGIVKRLNGNTNFVVVDTTAFPDSGPAEKPAAAATKENGDAPHNTNEIKVGKDKNGKFYVSVPKGTKIPKEVYEFLIDKEKGCRANFVKESNNYFGIEKNPSKPLEKRLEGTEFIVIDSSGDVAQKTSNKETGSKPKSKQDVVFTVRAEPLIEKYKEAALKKMGVEPSALPEQLIVVRGTDKADEALRDIMKEKYGAAPVKTEGQWEWVLTKADVKNQTSIYKELLDMRGMATQKKSELNTDEVSLILNKVSELYPEAKEPSDKIFEILSAQNKNTATDLNS